MTRAASNCVRVASPLRSYTAGAAEVSAFGATVGELLADLERAHPGIRFRMIDEQDRIRPHIRIFVNQTEVKTLDEPLQASDRVHLICALSGG
jgi:molybdopterin converting factor small subunit